MVAKPRRRKSRRSRVYASPELRFADGERFSDEADNENYAAGAGDLDASPTHEANGSGGGGGGRGASKYFDPDEIDTSEGNSSESNDSTDSEDDALPRIKRRRTVMAPGPVQPSNVDAPKSPQEAPLRSPTAMEQEEPPSETDMVPTEMSEDEDILQREIDLALQQSAGQTDHPDSSEDEEPPSRSSAVSRVGRKRAVLESSDED
ncbi:unnamed protein product [Dibothriocephalus latus]|uniref:Uncharacterized protein n=1 Tax=Dibothriocephalus latus TaxID=60516 RepID=A0A3P7P4T0_DIBLA|nr:unnamed protein product [Dibothriocephalus latus]